MALGILLVTRGTRNASMDSLFCSFIQHLLSPYHVQSTKTQICGDNMAAPKKHDLVVVDYSLSHNWTQICDLQY